jgi:hypothetical protein
MLLRKTQFQPLISSFNLSKISLDEWNQIKDYKFSYILSDKPDLVGLLYPGFVFSSDEAAKYYSKNVLDNIVNNLKAFTTPRGNLSISNNIIIVGYRPGSFTAHLSKAESAWLLGPSSNILMNLCRDLSIYPYFTNFYHSHYLQADKNLNNIFMELYNIFMLYKEIYHKDSLKIILLGNYSEYSDLIYELDKKVDFIKLKYISIWHPSFILRKNQSPELYEHWLNTTKKQINLL